VGFAGERKGEKRQENMKQKLIEFLELAEKASKFNPYTHENYLEHIEFYFRFLAIAPLAVRKLLEAAELLEKVIHYGKNCREGAIYIQARGEIVKQIQKFMEDFNDEN
jgi:hypothetical protein